MSETTMDSSLQDTMEEAVQNSPKSSPKISMVRRLILKDWYFQRFTIVAYTAAGALALALLSTGGDAAFFAGSILLVTVLIALGIHVGMETIVQERTEKTLAFVMSLPVSPMEYTTAKILANLLIFLVPWIILTVGSFGVIAARAAVPDGLIPFVAIMLTEILASYCLILAVALVSESQGWTIAAIIAGNLSLQAFMYTASHNVVIASTMKTNTIVWSRPALLFLLGLLVAIVLMLGLTFFFQSRKKDFV
ncbi:MAG: ABC-2 transporter permease [Thermoanaerobaculia bacterium]